MPARTLMIPVRVTPAEKALIQERAGGLGVSEYLRRLGMTGTVTAMARAERASEDEIQRLVRENMKRMPRPNAELQARREAARKAKEALDHS